jgi:putative membrane protein
MWVLAGFIEVFGLLFALSTLMRLSAKNRLPNKQDIKRARESITVPAA